VLRWEINITFDSAKPYDRRFFDRAREGDESLHPLFGDAFNRGKGAMLARGSPAICAFVNDQIKATACGGVTSPVADN
jgi:hypothetical protein